MKKNLIIIILSNFITIIAIILIITVTSAGTSKVIKLLNSKHFIEADNYYRNQMKNRQKEIEEASKYLNDARTIRKKEYEAENIYTSLDYNDFLNNYLNELKTSNSKDIFKPIGYYEYITSYKIMNDNLALILTDKNIYIKNGIKWEYVSLKGLNKSPYFTTGELFYYKNEPYIIAGTSYSGLFYKKITDKRLVEFNSGIQSQFATDSKMEFFETITSIHADDKNIYVGYSYSKGIDKINIEDFINNKKASFEKTNIILLNDASENIELFFEKDKDLYADSNYATYKYNLINSSWDLINKKTFDKAIKKTNTIGIYLNPYAVSSTKKIDEYISMCNELGINALVVDFKDEWGQLTYSSNIEFAKKIGAINKIINIDYLIEKCKSSNLKIIARIVTFVDGLAFDYNNNQYALWDWKNDKPWLGPKDYKWIDPYSNDYRNYLIEVAKELEKKGIDEIQYDYVRFPSDGELYNIEYRHKKKGFSKNFILYRFFTDAKKELNIPLSADFYGYNCWYLISTNIGQDISLTSRSLDIVYPMYYPSHFRDGFYQKNLNQYDRNLNLYYHGVIRAYQNSNYRIEIRPWIQIFNMKVDIALKDYINAQIEGLKKSGIDSYIFWSSSSNYKILNDVIAKK